MRSPDVGDPGVLPFVQRGKGDDAPDGVIEDHGQADGGGDHEEGLGLAVEAHRARPGGVGQHVDHGEHSGHHSKAQSHHVGHDQLVGEDVGAFVLGQLPHDLVGLSQQKVDQESEQLLKEDGEDQSEGQLLPQGHHREPEQRG